MLAALAFCGCLAGSFHFDDYSLFANPVVTAASGWWRVWGPVQTRPLTYFTFWLNYQAGGQSPFGYHLLNLALHLIAVYFMTDVLARLLPARVALIAAAIFALHPIQAEAICYVFARGSLLASLFCILALREWLGGRWWLAVAWFIPALLSKEECVAFPLFLVLLELSRRRPIKTRGAPLAAMLGLSLVFGLRVLWATSIVPGAGAGFGTATTPLSYFLSQGYAILRYFRLLAIPWGFTVDADIPQLSMLWSLAAWSVVLTLCVVASRRFRDLQWGFWFLAGMILLLPSSSLLPASDLATDRRLYLPLLGFASAAALLLPSRSRWLWCAVPLALLSTFQTLTWRSEEALWTHAVRWAPGKVRPKIQLARAVSPERGLALLSEAKSIAPDDPDIASEEGLLYLAQGRPALALAPFGRALALKPNDAAAISNRGVALFQLGQNEAARSDFERALLLDPCFETARRNLRQLGIDVAPALHCPE